MPLRPVFSLRRRQRRLEHRVLVGHRALGQAHPAIVNDFASFIEEFCEKLSRRPQNSATMSLPTA
jgi:hypothetical protein